MLRLGFAGTPEFAVAALDALTRSAHSVVAVFTQPDRPSGRGRGMHESPVKRRALELGVRVAQPESFKTDAALEGLRALELDALIVAAYGLILPAAALAIPRLGCFNVHASLLPRWRGAAPIQRAILAGDEVTGISIMRMQAGLDTGPVLCSREIAIGALETGGSLTERLASLGGELLCEALEALAADRATERPQPVEGVTYATKIQKSEALIDWQEDASAVLRRIRAFNPSPVAETRLAGAQVRIWEAVPLPLEARPAQPPPPVPPGTVERAAPEGIDVACGSGRLRLVRLQLAGRKPLPAREFIKSQHLEGARFARS